VTIGEGNLSQKERGWGMSKKIPPTQEKKMLLVPSVKGSALGKGENTRKVKTPKTRRECQKKKKRGKKKFFK